MELGTQEKTHLKLDNPWDPRCITRKCSTYNAKGLYCTAAICLETPVQFS